MNLANALGRNARRTGSNITSLQKEALAEIQRMTPFDPSAQEPEDFNIIHQWFRIFDRLFFLGSLEDYCTIEMIATDNTDYYGECVSNHLELGKFDHTPDDASCTIHMCQIMEDPSDPTTRLDSYLATLVHEMIHAVLEIYSCNCRLQCHAAKIHVTGHSGHGRAWHHIFASIRDACPEFLGRDIGLRADGEKEMAFEILSRMGNQARVSLSKDQVRGWAGKVGQLVGITGRRLRLWGFYLWRKLQNVSGTSVFEAW